MIINSVLTRTLGQGWLLLFLLLSGCGFQLRGEMPFSENFTNIYIKTNEPYSKFTKELTRALSRSHVVVVGKSQANYVLEILEYSETQSVSGYNPKAQLGSFMISVKVTYVLSVQEKPICYPINVTDQSELRG